MTKDTVIRLANNTKYFILDDFSEKNAKYFYGVRLDNHTDEPTDDYMVFEESYQYGKVFIRKVIDNKKLDILLNSFHSNISQS